MSYNLLQHFPESYTPNTAQVKLLASIDQAFEDGYKFVVCCAPTGSGKSFISKTISNSSKEPSKEFVELITSYNAFKHSHGGGYVSADECSDTPSFGAFALTITKTLQDQYKEMFDDISVLKGKSNYQCAIDDSYNVEMAPCTLLKSIKEDCWSKNKCPYYNARNQALISSFATLNYNMFFSLPSHVKKREYLVCDEASELEDQLVKQFTCTVNFDTLKKSEINIPPFDSSNYSKALKWVSLMSVRVSERIDEVKDIITKGSKGIKTLSKNFIDARKAEMLVLRALQTKLAILEETWSFCEYIFETDFKSVTFVPLKVDKLSRFLFNFGEKVVLMSATIIDHKNYCKSLGIDHYKYIEVDSSFDAKNAPIYVNTKVKLCYSNLNQNLPKIKKQIMEICEFHKNEKGLIHTHTNIITNYLNKNINEKRFLFREPGVNNEDILQHHYESSDPTVLVSPSMGYGVDLKDDLARFQIIIKAPYLPMNDKRIEKLMKLDASWYTNKMLGTLIQSCGRAVRSKLDYCATYILDGAIIESVIKNKNKLPKYFLDRFV
jgi:Rad3-related DNA helicase